LGWSARPKPWFAEERGERFLYSEEGGKKTFKKGGKGKPSSPKAAKPGKDAHASASVVKKRSTPLRSGSGNRAGKEIGKNLPKAYGKKKKKEIRRRPF